MFLYWDQSHVSFRQHLLQSEYAALLVALLVYFSTRMHSDKAMDVTSASTVAVVGQIGYVWARTILGYPAIPSMTMAMIRYSGLLLLTVALYQVAIVEPGQ